MAQRSGKRGFQNRSKRTDSNLTENGSDSVRAVIEDKVPKSPVELPGQTTVGELADILETSNVDCRHNS